MGIMSFLRERMGLIVVIVIGLALFAFIASEAVTYGRSFFSGDATTVGEVAGQKIKYEDFNKQVEANEKQYQQQFGQNLNPQMISYVQNMTWGQSINRIILRKEEDKLGIAVGDAETQNMISGTNPDPQIVRYFSNQQTGQFDRNQLNQFLGSLSAAPAELKEQWANLVTDLIESKRTQKYVALIHNGLYVNSLDAKDDYEAKNKLANFKYVALDYSTIPDNKVTLTDADYQAYYDEHKSMFKNERELRTIKYVSFNAAPSKADSDEVKKQADKLAADFKTTNNDSLFVQINAVDPTVKASMGYVKKGQLDPKIDSIMFGASKGFVYGPYISGGSYKVSKLVDEKIGPDSVKARHILIDPRKVGSLEKAQSQADSLKKLIAAGKSFADLAKMYSADQGSADKGGELGTFGRGAMVPQFEEAAFNGKKGELQIVTSQFGVHLLEVEDQKGSSKYVKVATVDRPIEASSQTQSTAFSKAQTFLSGANGENFEAEAKKLGLQVKTAEDIDALAASIPGVENAREMVKWVFTADNGAIADKAFTAGNQYVVPKLIEIKPEGTLPLDAVKKQIEAAVRNKVKAKQLTEKLNAALNGASSLEQVAQKLGGAAVVPVENVVFANPILPAVAQENKLVGAIFGSKPNKISKAIEGDHGVYAFIVTGFVNPAPLTNAVRQREQIAQALLQRADQQIFVALKDKANVKDYRAKFM